MPGSKSVESYSARFSAQKRTCLQAKAYLCISVIQALFSLYFLYMGYFHQLVVFSRGCRKTNKYTNIHTYTHTFRKTISRNQAHAFVSVPKYPNRATAGIKKMIKSLLASFRDQNMLNNHSLNLWVLTLLNFYLMNGLLSASLHLAINTDNFIGLPTEVLEP